MFVSAIIPCRNEEKFIGNCLDSVISQDYPKDDLEILVIDGASEDKTKEIIKQYSEKHSLVKLLENPKKYTPFGLNIGIKSAQGEVIVRMDAHATYQKDYISKCLKYLKEYQADSVGGIIKTIPQKDTLMAKAISLCLSTIFGAGGSYFRLGSDKPRWVDTVFSGCYKKEVFQKVGLFDERLLRSQDIEFNRRLRAAGGKILLAPDIESFYYPYADFIGFLKHNFSDGIWTILPLKFGVRIFSYRHLLPLALISALIILPPAIVFYLFFNILFSLGVAKNKKDLRLFPFLILAYFNRHLAYGAGSFFALLQTLSLKRLFDFFVSLFGLIIVSPFLIIIALLIKLGSAGPVFYRGERVGKAGKIFRIFKFRSMVEKAEELGGPSTAGDDPRLTKIGKFLKKFQLDEIPQLINVLKGEMSLVGPRPDTPSEIESLDSETRKIILSVKPGMTSPATLANPHEGEVLRDSKDPHKTYCEKIKPEKIKLNLEYVNKKSFWLDVKIIIKTFFVAVFK